MGCHPSKSELIREIHQLKEQEKQHIEIIKKLQEDNGLDGSHANYALINDQETIQRLEKENENLKLENTKLKEASYSEAITPASNGKPTANSPKKNLPSVGDKVLAMWSVSMWQYFTATIVKFDPVNLEFEINWDDEDESGRLVSYQNLALDRIPDDDEVAIGSVVLFPQGSYKGQEGVRLGGRRWHQGKITNVRKELHGIKYYSGRHTKGDEDGKWITFLGYHEEFSNLRRDQLRIAPNLLDLISADETTRSSIEMNKPVAACDIFLSYCKLNSYEALNNREFDKPPSYDEAMAAQSFCDPRKFKKQLSQDLNLNVMDYNGDVVETVKFIQQSKVIIAFISDEYAQDEICRQEFQYAKKTAQKPVIPVVVGSSFDWMMSVVGLLIAGELYIHFNDQNVFDAKLQELQTAIKKSIPSQKPEIQVAVAKPISLENADVFISYCWRNSSKALEVNQITELIGNDFADPRKVKQALITRNSSLRVWLDIEKLHTTNQSDESMSMFSQIATGINQAKVIIACVSDEYAKSDNCRAEFQFAATSMKKPIIPVIVGSGNAWQGTVLGLLLSAQENTAIDMRDLKRQEDFEACLDKIENGVKRYCEGGSIKQERVFSAPGIGDHVVCHHHKWAFYMATVVSFDSENLQYTVDWDDGDPSGRVQSYKNLAIDEVPSPEQIGMDTKVFFPQGSYGASEGNNTGGRRYHQGIITNIHKDFDSGITLYDGHHTKGRDDGKWVTYRQYSYEFANLTIEDLRVAPNAMDALMACKHAFLLGD